VLLVLLLREKLPLLVLLKLPPLENPEEPVLSGSA
jgi:hypothetical protein